MKKIDKLKNYLVEKNSYVFETIVGILICIIVASIVMACIKKETWTECLTIIVECIAAFGTVFAVYVALNKPEPKPDLKIDAYPISSEQFCITFINANLNSMIYFRLEKIKIFDANVELDPCPIDNLSENIRKDIVLTKKHAFYTLTVDTEKFAKVVFNNICSRDIKSKQLKSVLYFKTNYGCELEVKMPQNVLYYGL